MSQKGLILGLDFDGTCVEHAYPAIGDDIGAVPYLKKLSDGGVNIILWTMRSGGRKLPDVCNPGKKLPTSLMDAVAWFKKRDIKLFGINKNPDQKSWTRSPKAYCHKYLDDAAHGCPLIVKEGSRPYVDWNIVGPQLLEWAGLK